MENEINDKTSSRYIGQVIEMGDVAGGNPGVTIEIRPNVFITIAGFKQHDIMDMPNFLYKNVKLTIEMISQQP